MRQNWAGGTLGKDKGPGAEREEKSSGFWTASECKESITLKDLKAVTVILG